MDGSDLPVLTGVHVWSLGLWLAENTCLSGVSLLHLPPENQSRPDEGGLKHHTASSQPRQ